MEENQQVGQIAKKYGLTTVLWCGFLAGPFGILYAAIMHFPRAETWLFEYVAGFCGGLGVGLVATIINKKRFFMPIGKMVTFLDKVGHGELNKSLTGENFGVMDPMRAAFQRMGEGIETLMSTLTHRTMQIEQTRNALAVQVQNTASRAQDVATAITQVARGSNDQALAVQKIVMEIENVRDLVTRMADKSMKAASNAESIGTMALQGSGAIEEQKSQMESNRRVIDDMRNAIEELQQKSEQIGNIMQVITDIASQTNLLSLNASIEAARTGEQGRGFNVVAQEVRKLAEESARSAYEIGQLVANIQTSITQVVNETRAANRAVLEQEKAMDESLQVIDKVSNNFKSISHDMSNVSSRCQGIVGAVDEVTTAIQGISAVTQENSAGSEEMSSTAEEQSAYMQSLNGLVDEFDTLLKNLKSTIGKFRTVD